MAILAIDNIEVDDHILRASYGTTKYCTFFLKNCDCPNKDCLYLHNLADDSDIINRDDMNSNTSIFYEQQLLAMKLADIFNPEVKKKIKTVNKKKCIFPTPDTIYSKDIVLEQSPDYEATNSSSNSSSYHKYYDNYNSNYKKKYNENDYYSNNYYKRYDNYNDDYYKNEDDFQNQIEKSSEEDMSLHREISENVTAKTNKTININGNPNLLFNSNNKFISKSKSPITNKKKNISSSNTDAYTNDKNNSLSPSLNNSNKIIDNNVNNILSFDPYSTNLLPSSPENKNGDIFDKITPVKFYRKREYSRFSFVNSACKNEKMNFDLPENINIIEKITTEEELVPDYVSDVICKKFSRHSFFMKFSKEFQNFDNLFLEKDLKQNDSWSKFIISNMEKIK